MTDGLYCNWLFGELFYDGVGVVTVWWGLAVSEMTWNVCVVRMCTGSEWESVQ